MPLPIRLLIAARQPGSASHLCRVAAAAHRRSDMTATVFASPAASGIFSEQGVVPRVIADTGDLALAAARAVIDEIRPDALLVGMSGPDRGLDEALLATAPTPHTYVMQDFWGDVNPGFGKQPGTFLVIDDTAAEITRRRARDARVVVVGHAQFAALAGNDPQALRESQLQALGGGPTDTVVGFYGQGHVELPEYWLMVKELATALDALPLRPRVVFRPHPRESSAQKERTQEILGDSCRPDPAPTIAQSVAGCDVLVTWFSSCGMVLAHLNRMSHVPLGTILYLNLGRRLQEWYKAHNHIPTLPLEHLSITVDRFGDVAAGLERALRAKERKRLWELTRRTLSPPEDSVTRILDLIASDVRKTTPC